MSLIERAAGKLGKSPSQAEKSAAASSPPELERSLIEASIEQAEASFSQADTRRNQPSSHTGLDDDGPATVLGSQHGEVSLNQLRHMGALTPDAGRSKIAEEYRLIKRPLLANALGHGGNPPVPNGNLIMVTSSVPGEGKSFTAINLAISMATELENTVLLIDADVTKSAVLRYLGLKSEKGLIDVLRNPAIQLSDVLIKTDIAKLTVLPAGPVIAHATELLASSAMRNFVNEIANRYHDRIIIFDTPPLLSTSEASVLASYMGQVVFVVEAERTPQDAVRDALAHLADVEHVGIVLNKAPARSADGGYYGYGYGYGGYGEYSQ